MNADELISVSIKGGNQDHKVFFLSQIFAIEENENFKLITKEAARGECAAQVGRRRVKSVNISTLDASLVRLSAYARREITEFWK